MTTPAVADLVTDRIRPVADYPEPGVLFRDITPLLADGEAFETVVQSFAAPHDGSIDLVAGIEARGFLFCAPVALTLGCGVVPVRKAGKLPPPTHRRSYQLEYGAAELEVTAATPLAGARVLLLDDVLATGGTARAAAELLDQLGAQVVEIAVLLELADLGGRSRLTDWPIRALATQ